MNQWLLLIYKIPRNPSAHRVSIWRKIKQLGAVLLHDAVWVLPANARTQEQFQWLAAEIIELGGEATVCVSELLGKQDFLVKRFSDQADAAYREILSELRRKDADRAALARRYQQVSAQDYFQSKLGEKVRAALLKNRKDGP
ncbi:MAG: ChrB protein [Planctomycetes bacterium]|nr:ChrB protein [Planctomycetota bacterium]